MTKISAIFGFSILIFTGCGVLQPFKEARVEAHQGFYQETSAAQTKAKSETKYPPGSLILTGVPATTAQKDSPVSAVWFNYHYGLVLAAILISSAVGFLWAVNKKHPEYLAAIEKNIISEIKKLEDNSLIIPKKQRRCEQIGQ